MIVFLLGTRPDIIKMAPLIKATNGKKVVHTGQHYTQELDEDIRKDMGIEFDYRIIDQDDLESPRSFKSVYQGVADVLAEIAETSMEKGLVVAYGDTLSAMAGAAAAKAEGWKLAHVEAGLRSYDMTMPEEVSRLAIDSMSDRMYAPTRLQKEFLEKEGINGDRVQVLGNVIVDAVRYAQENKPDLDKQEQRFVLATLHRPENVDHLSTLVQVLELIVVLAAINEIREVLLPCHPRSMKHMEDALSRVPGSSIVKVIEPMSYLQLIATMEQAEYVMTDSGGLQEETAILGKKCITIRKSTERQETIVSGHNCLISPLTHTFGEALTEATLHLQRETPPPIEAYGQDVSRKIAEDLMNWRNW